ncbi:hypothetical protein DDZ18_13250 [Marinicauda salina]|uniref:Uncharacterized protein n=1 Tax=Marinicauda salina TaxID=2135793 RepID=A0A2U2BQU9_9PROT|nr:hypothetical protein [Marinicauda salina]PWE16384.1 hypothetical protein DDZ18_13250 [Marinicauda salina]
MAWLRIPAGYLAAVAIMAVAGVLAQTQFVLSDLKTIGADIGWDDRLFMTRADLVGLTPTYAVFIAIGFAIAFIAAALALRLIQAPRGAVYAGAGAVCMAVMLYLMREVFFGASPIAGTRSTAGFAAQLALGAAAGWLFAALTARR